MLTHQQLSRADLRRIKELYSVKKPDRFFFLYQDLDFFSRFLNELHSHDGDPDPGLSFEDQLLRKWTEDVLAPLCPTQAQKSKERKGLTWAARAETSIGNYYGYFGKWAHGSLKIRLIHQLKRLHCFIEPGLGNKITGEEHIAYKIWDAIYFQEGFKRLKRCHQCETWFVDKGKNRIARFCSESCTNRWWNKSRRLDSPNLGKRKKRKRGGAP